MTLDGRTRTIAFDGSNILDSARQEIVVRTPSFRDRLKFEVKGRSIMFGLAYNFGSNGKPRREQGFDFAMR